VVRRRRRDDGDVARERDDADLQAARDAFEEGGGRRLGGRQARGPDVLRLHRAGPVDDEDHRRPLDGCEAPQLRPCDGDRERHEREPEQGGGQVRAPDGVVRRDGAEHLEVREADRVALPAAREQEVRAERGRDEEQRDEQPGALEAHRILRREVEGTI